MITTLISKNKLPKKLTSLLLVLFLLAPGISSAQEALTLSISPSLFDMSVNPNQEWRSSLRVINVNDYDLTVYLDVVNFLPQGEGGNGRFVPISNDTETKGSTLAEWFIINRDPIVVPREQSLEIPIAVRVPEGAAPGGHFAAILVGTKPPETETGQARVQTSQMVTSLFFARVAGDIRELGTVREFTTSKSLLSSPEVNFELRFENKGNVHLQPQGEIKITNMWGQERGIIPINQSTQFGNVLPESIRKFNFAWKGEWSFSDIGRYTAEVTLAYGTEARQFANAITTFWVIPFKLLFGILLVLALFGLAATWLVRRYVNRMLTLAGIDVNEYHNTSAGKRLQRVRKERTIPLHQPMLIGLADFRSRMNMASGLLNKLQAIITYVVLYRFFFAAIVLLLLFVGLLTWYITGANTDSRGYEIEYVNADANLKLTSEEIIYRQLKLERETISVPVDESLPLVKIVNRSGVPGLGAEAKLLLEKHGYKVVELEADFTKKEDRTFIISSVALNKEAVRLSSRLNNPLVSTFESPEADDLITVYVGDDIRSLE